VTTSVCIPSSGLVTPNVVSDNVEIAAIGLVSGIFFYRIIQVASLKCGYESIRIIQEKVFSDMKKLALF
jgi:hypothetical protein